MISRRKYLVAFVLVGLALTYYLRTEILPEVVEGKLKAEVQFERNRLKQIHEAEVLRLWGLQAVTHPKCPSKPFLTPNFTKHKKVPAYPHLSDIYLYVTPPFKQTDTGTIPHTLAPHFGWPLGFKYEPMTVDDVEQARIAYPRTPLGRVRPAYRWRETFTDKNERIFDWGMTDAAYLESLQPENLTPVIVNFLQNTLAYCTAGKDGIPKKIKIVDTPRHENLEQEDALTIVIGAVSHLTHDGTCDAHARATVIELYTSQYIPRWKVYPMQYLRSETTKRIISGFHEEENDPYRLTERFVTNFYPPPYPRLTLEQQAELWFEGDSYLRVRYKPIKVIDELEPYRLFGRSIEGYIYLGGWLLFLAGVLAFALKTKNDRLKITLYTIIVVVVISGATHAKSIWYHFFDPGERVSATPLHKR
tara:strand:+ start:178 stop:1431 length:1254 start_codon:yes stop_codon:yes gene_type:complete